MDTILVFKLLDVLLTQPLHMLIMAVAVAVLTGVIKIGLKFIKRLELTYFVPYILGIVCILSYSAIMKIPLSQNIGQIIINGVYVALSSGILFQLYKAIKDIGIKAILKDSKTIKLYDELKGKLKNSLNSITYAKRISLLDSSDISSMIETLRGSGIEERNLYSLANDLSIIASSSQKIKKCKDIKIAIEESEGDNND